MSKLDFAAARERVAQIDSFIRTKRSEITEIDRQLDELQQSPGRVGAAEKVRELREQRDQATWDIADSERCRRDALAPFICAAVDLKPW